MLNRCVHFKLRIRPRQKLEFREPHACPWRVQFDLSDVRVLSILMIRENGELKEMRLERRSIIRFLHSPIVIHV